MRGRAVNSVRVEAYAKVNLGLAVLDRRADGFHNIETVFQSVSLADSLTLTATAAGDTSLETTGLDVPAGEDNLAWRASALLVARLGCPGARIEMTKRIPVAAGLGGGSADAAAVLAGMNELHGLGLSARELHDLAAELGSDVPFMLDGGSAFGAGRGEVLERLEPLTGVCFVLVTPPFGVSAGEAYEMARIGLTDHAHFIRVNCSAIREGDIPRLAKGLRNDLEAGVVSARPEVGALKREVLAAGAMAAAMSGSGPTVFGMAGSLEEGESIASRLTGRDRMIHVVTPIDVGNRVTRSDTAAS